MAYTALDDYPKKPTVVNLAKVVEFILQERGEEYACRFLQGNLEDELDSERGECSPENQKYKKTYQKLI